MANYNKIGIVSVVGNESWYFSSLQVIRSFLPVVILPCYEIVQSSKARLDPFSRFIVCSSLTTNCLP